MDRYRKIELALATRDRPTPADPLDAAIDRLRSLALCGLKRMYCRDQGLFAFRARRDSNGALILEGSSPRYTAIALIGLASEQPDVSVEVLGEGEAARACRRLIDGVEQVSNLGDAALTLWAALAMKDEAASKALDRLVELGPVEGAHPTVEVAWCLAALMVDATLRQEQSDLARQIADRLIRSFVPRSGVFRHWPVDVRGSVLRGHVACFADLVYPIQALAHYHAATGDEAAIQAARRCAEQMCAMQGAEGQWWWHWDLRTGRVIEPYPVYAVHQDAMAPMALLAIQEVTGQTYRSAIERGVRWLLDPVELRGPTGEPACSLLDESLGVIWRKVARHEPGKFSRTAQALASRIHRGLRVPGLGWVFRPGRIDYECRPYHLGWLLLAWSNRKLLRDES